MNYMRVELNHAQGTKDIALDTLVTEGVWPTHLPTVGTALVDFESTLRGCRSPQEITDKTLKFVKDLLNSKCGCIRTAKSGLELRFKSSDCNFAKEENRTYRLAAKTTITKAAREGISIVVKDQSEHPDNGRRGEDKGSLITVTVPRGDLRYTERFQATCCDFDRTGHFDIYHAVLVNFILRRMEEAYCAIQYRSLQPFLSRLAEKYRTALASFRVLGAAIADEQLASLVEDAIRQIPHNYAWFIGLAQPDDPDPLEIYPLLVPTSGSADDMDAGIRNGQKQILSKVLAEHAGAVVYRRGERVYFKNPSNPAESTIAPERAWDPTFSVAVVPLTLEQELLGV